MQKNDQDGTFTFDQIIRFKQKFQELDKQGSNKLDIDGIKILVKYMELPINDKQTQQLMEIYEEKELKMGFSQLINLLHSLRKRIKLMHQTQESFMEEFQQYDRDGDGQITVLEFRYAINKLLPSGNLQDVRFLFQDLDEREKLVNYKKYFEQVLSIFD